MTALFKVLICLVHTVTLPLNNLTKKHSNIIPQVLVGQITIEVAEDVLEFVDLKLTFDKEYKRISVNIFAKATNSFTYLLPSTCFRKNNIENVPKSVALRLRKICDSDDKFDERSVQYQKYLTARDYKPSKVEKQFSDFRMLRNALNFSRKTLLMLRIEEIKT